MREANDAFGKYIYLRGGINMMNYAVLSDFVAYKIIDIMIKYDCPLYDSTINVRFDG